MHRRPPGLRVALRSAVRRRCQAMPAPVEGSTNIPRFRHSWPRMTWRGFHGERMGVA